MILNSADSDWVALNDCPSNRIMVIFQKEMEETKMKKIICLLLALSCLISVVSASLSEYCNINDDGSMNSMYGNIWDSQSFTIGYVGINSTINLTMIRMKLTRIGTPNTIYISIRAVNGSEVPTGSDLSTGTTNGNTLTSDFAGEWRNVSMTPYELKAGTQYSIVAHINGGDSTNRVLWKSDASNPTYNGGIAGVSINSGVVWTPQPVGDYMFEIYGIQSSIPSGDCDYYVGEEITLPQITTTKTYDDGITHKMYLACLYDLDGNSGFESMIDTQTCRKETQTITLEDEGEYTYNLAIAFRERQWNQESHEWETISEGTDVNSKTSFSVCSIPDDEEGWQGFMDWVGNLLCQWFGWFC